MIISEFNKDKLQQILNDELLLSAIRNVFDETIEEFKPNVGETTDNVLLGEKFRSYETAKEIIKKGFINLLSYKINKKVEKTFNKGR